MSIFGEEIKVRPMPVDRHVRITEISLSVFNCLQMTLNSFNLDEDSRKFMDIYRALYNDNYKASCDKFAFEVFYVICLAGFKQEYAKEKYEKVVNFIQQHPNFTIEELSTIYGNARKVEAIHNVWHNREKYHSEFYSIQNNDEKVDYLATLKYVGNITKYHLARNLGLDYPKYDIRVQKLAVALNEARDYKDKVSNSKLDAYIKTVCDKLIRKIADETGEKMSFIDLVLSRSCQLKLLTIEDDGVYLDADYDGKPYSENDSFKYLICNS